MATLSAKQWKTYAKKLARAHDEAGELMKEYIRQQGYSDPKKLVDYAYFLTSKYSKATGALACEMYDSMAYLEGTLLPEAVMAEAPSYGEVAKTVYGTMKNENDELVSGAVSRLVKRRGADTIVQNAKRDGAEIAWIPSGDSCPYCEMIAGEGWQHVSEAGVTSGHADHIHAHCDCTFAIRTSPETTVKGYYPEKYRKAFEDAPGDTMEEKLNAQRRERYAENKDEINAAKRELYAEQHDNRS